MKSLCHFFSLPTDLVLIRAHAVKGASERRPVGRADSVGGAASQPGAGGASLNNGWIKRRAGCFRSVGAWRGVEENRQRLKIKP